MPEKKNTPVEGYRNTVACGVLIVAGVSIVGLGVATILLSPSNAQSTFNLVLPVLASWVATVLVFYFGRENFESASRQVREMADKLTPEQRAKTPRLHR
jgi:ABC-type sugar transport system permease subunit